MVGNDQKFAYRTKLTVKDLIDLVAIFAHCEERSVAWKTSQRLKSIHPTASVEWPERSWYLSLKLSIRNLRFDTRCPMEGSRRDFLRSAIAAGAAALLSGSHAAAEPTSLLQKRIPSSGEMIPIIGMGTARRYEQIRTDTEKI